MHRGIEIDIHLRPGLRDESFVAQALGNLAAFRLAAERRERLDWQVLWVNAASGHHHFRLVVRHPERRLDIGFASGLTSILDDLSHESVDELRDRLTAAEKEGLRIVPLRHVHEDVDYWEDQFWKFMGGPSGIGTPGSFP